MEQESLLTDVEFNPVLASTGKRFLNYIIDVIIFYVLTLLIGMIFALQLYKLTLNESVAERRLSFQLIAFILYFLYFFLCETIFKGRTIGKFVTGTRVIMQDGVQPDVKTYLLRALSRLVPFEPFSALGNPPHPWHDKWTNTYVIDIKKTALNDLSQQY